MALSGRPAEACATLALAEGLAAALPGVRTRPERGLRASRVLPHLPEMARLSRCLNPVLLALHGAKNRAGGRQLRSGGGSDTTTLDAFLNVAEGPIGLPSSPTSPASQSGAGEADIVFVLERAPSSVENAALRSLLFEALRGADCFEAFWPVPHPAALGEARSSDPTTPPDHVTRVGPAASRVVPSPERASGRENVACYLLCEVTTDARWLLHKLIQLELNARALAMRVLDKAVSEAWVIPPCDVALVVAMVGVAIPLGAPSSQQAPRVVRFLAHLPFLEHMHDTGRLFFLGLGEDEHITNVIVANMLLSNMAIMEDVATLKSDVATLKSDVAALKSDVAAPKSDVADILTLLRAGRSVVHAAHG